MGTSRVVGSVVIKSTPIPAARPRRGRQQRWANVYRAIETMLPGEWFLVTEHGKPVLDEKEMKACASAIRKWIDANEFEGVIVYLGVDGVIVAADRLQKEMA